MAALDQNDFVSGSEIWKLRIARRTGGLLSVEWHSANLFSLRTLGASNLLFVVRILTTITILCGLAAMRRASTLLYKFFDLYPTILAWTNISHCKLSKSEKERDVLIQNLIIIHRLRSMPFLMESLNDSSVPFLKLQKVRSVIGFAMKIYQLSDFLYTQSTTVVVKIWKLHDGGFHRPINVRFSVFHLWKFTWNAEQQGQTKGE